MSDWLGSAIPEGWLCANITAAALSWSESLTTSLGWTEQQSILPLNISENCIKRCLLSKNSAENTSCCFSANFSTRKFFVSCTPTKLVYESLRNLFSRIWRASRITIFSFIIDSIVFTYAMNVSYKLMKFWKCQVYTNKKHLINNDLQIIDRHKAGGGKSTTLLILQSTFKFFYRKRGHKKALKTDKSKMFFENILKGTTNTNFFKNRVATFDCHHLHWGLISGINYPDYFIK